MQVDKNVLSEAMSKLSPIQRIVLHRMFWDGDDCSEIARDMKMRTQEVSKIVESTMKVLKLRLK